MNRIKLLNCSHLCIVLNWFTMSTSRLCNISCDSFCYVCGHYVAPKQVKHKIVKGTKFFSAYELYFRMPMGDQDKSWAHHYICGSCRSTLEAWLRGTRKCMPFAIPRIWRNKFNIRFFTDTTRNIRYRKTYKIAG